MQTTDGKQSLCPNCFARINVQNKCPVCGYDVSEIRVLDQNKLAPGTLLKDRYYIGRPLGQGGFGITYIAYDLMLNIKLAIKEYYPSGIVTRIEGSKAVTNISPKELSDYREGLEKFLEEARTLAQFSQHPNIVPVRDYFEYNGTAYMVMGYLEGQTLLQYLDSREGHLSFTDTCRFMFPVMDALNVVHASGLIHRDISPDNLFITKDGTVKLLDFGAAKSALALVAQQKHSIVLKKGYSPAEQYREDGRLGPWTDIYSMGATFYRCLTGEVPQDSIDRLFNDKVVELKDKTKDIPVYAIDAILKAMSINEADRFQNMADFKEVLSKQTGTGVSLQQNKSQKPAKKQSSPVQSKLSSAAPKAPKQKNSKIIAIAAFIIVVLLGIGGFALFKFNGNEAETIEEQKSVVAEQKTDRQSKTTAEKPKSVDDKEKTVQDKKDKTKETESTRKTEQKTVKKKTVQPKRADAKRVIAKKTTTQPVPHRGSAKVTNVNPVVTLPKPKAQTAVVETQKPKAEQQTTVAPVQTGSVASQTANAQNYNTKKHIEENRRKLQSENNTVKSLQNSTNDAAKKHIEENRRKLQSENNTAKSSQNSTNDAAKKHIEENLLKLRQEQ